MSDTNKATIGKTYAAICPVCGSYAALTWSPVFSKDNEWAINRFRQQWEGFGLIIQEVTEEQERAASYGCGCILP